MRVFAAAVALVLLTLTPVRSRADDPTLAIDWTAPEGCPPLGDVRGYLDAVIPDDVRARLEGVAATVELVAVPGGFRAFVRVERGDFVGERTVDGRRCDDVARSAIIVISVALTEAAESQPSLTVPEPSTPVSEPPPVPEDAPSVPVDPVEPLPSARSSEEAARFAIGVDVGLSTGFGSSPVAPRVGVVGRVAIHPLVHLGVRLRGVPRASIRAGDETVGRLAEFGVVPDVCVLAHPSERVALGGCALVEVGVVVAHGAGLADDRRAIAGFATVGVEPTVEVGRRVRLRLALEGDARVVRPRFVVSGDGVVEHTPAIAFGARAGILVRIP